MTLTLVIGPPMLKQLILAHQDLATTLLQWLLLALQVLLLYPTLLQQVSKLILPDEFSYLFLFYLFKIHLLPLGWTQQWLLKWRHWSSRWTKCTKRSSTARATELVKKRKFEQPNFPLETMEDFGDLEDKLRDHRFQRFMVSSSFPSLLLELVTFLYLLDRLLGAERKHWRSWHNCQGSAPGHPWKRCCFAALFPR